MSGEPASVVACIVCVTRDSAVEHTPTVPPVALAVGASLLVLAVASKHGLAAVESKLCPKHAVMRDLSRDHAEAFMAEVASNRVLQ